MTYIYDYKRRKMRKHEEYPLKISICTPNISEEGRYYRFQGQGRLARFLESDYSFGFNALLIPPLEVSSNIFVQNY